MSTSIGRVRRLALTALSVVLLVSGAPAVAYAADTPEMTGSLTSPDGQPIPDVVVTASVEPTDAQMRGLPDGSEIQPTEVGWGYTWDDGSFEVWISYPEVVAAARDEDGLISMVLSAPTSAGQVFYRTRLTMAADGRLGTNGEDVQAATQDLQPGQSVVTAAADGSPHFDLVPTQVTPTEVTPAAATLSARNRQSAAVTTSGDTAGAPLDPEEKEPARTDQPVYDPQAAAAASAATLSAGSTNAPSAAPGKALSAASAQSLSAAAAASSFDPDVWCGGNHWYLRKSKDVVRHHITLASQATGKHSTGAFEYKTSKSTSLEVGVTNMAGSLVTTLGMQKGTTVSASIKGTIGKNTKAEWWISYDFNIYDVMCQSNTTFVKWWSGYTEYRPKAFAGDASRRSWTAFSCNSSYRNTIGSSISITVANDKTTTRTGSFGVGSTTTGNLKASQTWSSSQSVTYDADSVGFNICGYKGRWTAAVTKTQEVT